MKISYKKTTPKNYPDIVRLVNEAEKPYHRLPIIKRMGIDLTLADHDLRKNRMKRKYRILTIDNEIVGFLAWKKKFNNAWLSEFVISPEHQNKGYGEKMLRLLEKEIGKKFDYLTLEYWPDAIWAERFYLKHGYKYMPGIFENKSEYTRVLTKKVK